MAFEVSMSKKLAKRFARLANPDPRPLLDEAERILIEENVRRSLAGLDKDGRRLEITLREQGIRSRAVRVTASRRQSAESRRWLASFLGGTETLSRTARPDAMGPPLAPHGAASRIVVLARTRSWVGVGLWHAQLGWDSFDSESGRPILPMHAQGIPSRRGPIVRDVLGTTPTMRARARAALRAYVRSIFPR